MTDAASPRMLLNERGAEVWHCSWERLAERARELGGVDALIVDAPYSERTHKGHDDGASRANDVRESYVGHGSGGDRRPIDYEPWSQSDVESFVTAWSTVTNGWMVSITDHCLSAHWSESFSLVKRYPFAPLPYVHVGGRVRLSGDGPSSWTCWVVAARPRNKEFAKWGTLPGAYVLNGGHERLPVVGGKPLWLMRALVRDYTRPGDLVCDPCGGAMTTGLACILEGRRFLGGDAMLEHAQLGVERLRELPGETKAGQLALLSRAG